MLSLSQSHLQLLSVCPPQFQRRYLEKLGGLIDPEVEQRSQWGREFHQLMQQWSLGLPVTPFKSATSNNNHRDQQLINAVNALTLIVPALQLPRQHRHAEHRRSLTHDSVLLTVVYDLLATTATTAEILDWKTYAQPPKKERLINHWQTRLYLYVLAETSDYSPENLSMTYWFVQSPENLSYHTIAYNTTKHQQTQQALAALVTQLHRWLADWQTHRSPFPHTIHCPQCPYHQDFFPIETESSPVV